MANYTDADWVLLFEKVEAQVLPQPSRTSASSQAPIDVSELRSNPRAVAQFIDHTELRLDATEQDIDKLCDEAVHHGFATVCVRQHHVQRAHQRLLSHSSTPAAAAAATSSSTGGSSDGPAVRIASVISFHEGTASASAKACEAVAAVAGGATELDVVLNRSALQGGGYAATYAELAGVREAAPAPVVLKLILETAALGAAEVVRACVLAERAGWEFVKTSTGFCGRGASVQDVLLMAACAEYLWDARGGLEGGGGRERKMLVKASGGVRSLQNAIDMITAGASRIGTSGGVRIVQEVVQEDKGDQSLAANSGTY